MRARARSASTWLRLVNGVLEDWRGGAWFELGFGSSAAGELGFCSSAAVALATDLGSSESSLELVVVMSLFSIDLNLQRNGIGCGLFEEESETRKKEMSLLLLERENKILEVLRFCDWFNCLFVF